MNSATREDTLHHLFKRKEACSDVKSKPVKQASILSLMKMIKTCLVTLYYTMK